MCDHTAWGARVVREVNSPRVKLLYDIYHMQIMEGDLIATIRENIKWLGHLHNTAGPVRLALDVNHEINVSAFIRANAAPGFDGYASPQLSPTHHPLPPLLYTPT